MGGQENGARKRRGSEEVRGQWASGEVKGEEREQEVKRAQDKEGRRRKCFFFLVVAVSNSAICTLNSSML